MEGSRIIELDTIEDEQKAKEQKEKFWVDRKVWKIYFYSVFYLIDKKLGNPRWKEVDSWY